ncbi:BTAD domain-containing putative transcriptional regulator [Streptomyces sp. NPDC097619]|uniref:AfsR/SARP family transcriptional regulator n=1 Tax=Streptomyces sp. NPDC097619 TaxID=3157228 RepID=UPI003323B9A6
MRFGVLGPLEVWTDDGRPVLVGEPKVRALLADLLVHTGRPLSRDRLLDDLWGEDLPARPAAALQNKVWQLRRTLEEAEPGGRALVVSRAPGYLIAPAPEALDAARFEGLTARARTAAGPAARAALLTDALALWRGPAYGEFTEAEFTLRAVRQLEEQRVSALEEQAEARLQLGAHRPLADELTALTAAHPLRERLHAVHLRALYLSGRQSEALTAYDRLRGRLRDELGLDPGPELTALHRAILRQDPALTPPAVPSTPATPGPPPPTRPGPPATPTGTTPTPTPGAPWVTFSPGTTPPPPTRPKGPTPEPTPTATRTPTPGAPWLTFAAGIPHPSTPPAPATATPPAPATATRPAPATATPGTQPSAAPAASTPAAPGAQPQGAPPAFAAEALYSESTGSTGTPGAPTADVPPPSTTSDPALPAPHPSNVPTGPITPPLITPPPSPQPPAAPPTPVTGVPTGLPSLAVPTAPVPGAVPPAAPAAPSPNAHPSDPPTAPPATTKSATAPAPVAAPVVPASALGSAAAAHAATPGTIPAPPTPTTGIPAPAPAAGTPTSVRLTGAPGTAEPVPAPISADAHDTADPGSAHPTVPVPADVLAVPGPQGPATPTPPTPQAGPYAPLGDAWPPVAPPPPASGPWPAAAPAAWDPTGQIPQAGPYAPLGWTAPGAFPAPQDGHAPYGGHAPQSPHGSHGVAVPYALPAGYPAPAPARPRTNLPVAPTELVGRTVEVATLRALLTGGHPEPTHHAPHLTAPSPAPFPALSPSPGPRLVTLTGPGGVGKTRLALEAAGQVQEQFPDGVWLVELSGLDRTTLPAATATLTATAPHLAAVSHLVAAALGMRDDTAADHPAPTTPTTAAPPTDHLPHPPHPPHPLDRLAAALAGRRSLLLLDNCEHVVDSVAALAGILLARAPHLRILATSQEPLGIAGEALHPVPPLALPPATDTDPETVRRSAAVRLFLARARATHPAFTLDADNAPTVAALCRRLDGLPLALELAATRVRTLGLRELAARLDDRFRVLAAGHRDAPARQRTLRAVIDWSWDLLTEEERAVLRRLAVHAEGCTLEAAEAVCAGEGVTAPEVLDLLTRLVDRSLVAVTETPAGVRYRLLESVAAYCLERLDEAAEGPATRLRHAEHYLALAETAAPHLRGRTQRTWLERLDTEAANLRAALETTVRTGAADEALRLVIALSWYWFLRGRLGEALRSFDSALTVPVDGTRACGTHRADATVRRAAFALHSGAAEGPAAVDRALLALDDIADPCYRAHALWLLALTLYGSGDLAANQVRVAAALTAFEELDDTWGRAAALSLRAGHAFIRGDFPAAARDATVSLDLFRELGDRWGRLRATDTLASLAEIEEDYERAARLHREGLHRAEELGLWTDASYKWSGLGRIALLTGDYAAAREYHENGRRLAAEQSHKRGEQFAETGLALVARREGRLDDAEAHLDKWLDWLRTVYGDLGTALVMAELGFIAEHRGDAVTARARHLAGYAAARETGDPRALALALEGLAGAHVLTGRHDRAARLLGAAAEARASVGRPLAKAEGADVARISGAARRALGETRYAAEFATGRGTAPDTLVGPEEPADHPA